MRLPKLSIWLFPFLFEAGLLQAAPALSAPTASPSTLITGISTQVTANCRLSTSAGDPALLTGGLNLVRLTAAGADASILGVMHDDGLNGDVTAGDGIYTLQFTTSEAAAGSFELQCAGAFQKTVQRVRSSATTVNVLAGGNMSVSAPTLSPASIPISVPTSVTITSVITDPSLVADSAQVQRLDASGRVLATLGTLEDNGLNGDATAGDHIFTLVTTFTEGATGPISLRVSAQFAGSVTRVFSGLATLTVTGTGPPQITITSPSNLSFVNISPTTVTGTVSTPGASLVVNGVTTPVVNGAFSVQIPLAEGPNILAVTATAPNAPVATQSITVNLDTTPPRVTITSPPDQFSTADASVSIAGNVNDIVVGTVNSQQVRVTVNGAAAAVSNRTFLAMNVPLNMGANTISAVGTDRAGNSYTTSITVTRTVPPPVMISVVSGNNQNAVIGTALPQPLVAQVTQGGTPLANQQVIFKVDQNNALLTPVATSVTTTPGISTMVMTDANGMAKADMTLGMRAGAGGNVVEAYSVGVSGTAYFTATGMQSPAAMIVVDSGNSQTGAVNQQLPSPLIAVVVDSGNNRLAGVPVTFTVQQGGGSIGGQASVTVNTDSDGRAAAKLTLGFQEGNANNLVTADFPGDKEFPASFSASALLAGDPTQTLISGVVLDNSNNPISNVTIRAALTTALNLSSSNVNYAATTTSNVQGQFTITGAQVGYVKLLVDGSTATPVNTYPNLEYNLVTVAGQNNSVGQPIFLLPISSTNQLCVTATMGGGTLTLPNVPGFSLTFAPGQVTFPGNTKTGCVSVTTVHPDKVPMSPGFGQQPRFIVTIQPTGATFNPPAAIAMPNVDGLEPNVVTEMYSFDHDIGSFVAIGTGQVSADGTVIRSSMGVGVLKAGWHCWGESLAIWYVL